MTTLAQIQDGIVEALRAVDGLSAGISLPASPVFPYAHVDLPGSGIYDGTFSETGQWGGPDGDFLTFPVRVFVGATLHDEAVRRARDYIEATGTQSVRQALRFPTGGLNGMSEVACYVHSWSRPEFQEQGFDAYGVTLSVRVQAPRG